MSDVSIDYNGYNHCGHCRSRADVVRYDTFYKLVECPECGETSYIPKRCATGFDRFREFLKGEREEWVLPDSAT